MRGPQKSDLKRGQQREGVATYELSTNEGSHLETKSGERQDERATRFHVSMT